MLAFYGDTDAWMPIDHSVNAWRAAAARGGAEVTVRKLDGCDHLPILNGVETAEAISPQYANTTRDWINAHLA